MDVLSRHVIEFFALLRERHGFACGHAEARDAFRALEAIGIEERARVRSALRLVSCGSPEQVVAFDRAFDDFFTPARQGIPQPAYQPRHTRPERDEAPAAHREDGATRAERADEDGGEGEGGGPVRRRSLDEAAADEPSRPALRAHYSPAASAREAAAPSGEPDDAMRAAARRLVAGLRLGRSRRWATLARDGRFDARRTMRASLQTGGDPIDLRFRGHPLRNPRFALLVDGSRSMSDRTQAFVAFARALCSLTARADAFFFSTELSDVTRSLRASERSESASGEFANLDEAWGGGTRIGASLEAFLTGYGARLLSPETLVIIFSDGLDVGDVRRLESAMREIDRRSAGIVWLNPHAATPGYAPTARGMRAALPYVTLFAAAPDANAFDELAARIAREPRLHGKRR